MCGCVAEECVSVEREQKIKTKTKGWRIKKDKE
jgi:hypothetical protein